MAVDLDRRTRNLAEVTPLTLDGLRHDVLPHLIARNGPLVAAAMTRLGVPPLSVEVDGDAVTLVVENATLAIRDGAAAGALHVVFDEAQLTQWGHLQRGLNGMAVFGELNRLVGTDDDVSAWDALWLALLEGWPVIDDDLQFLDRRGDPLDLGQSFTRDDDPAEIAHFLREAGYLHLRGWLDPVDMAAIADEIDRAVPCYTEDDGRSWWAELEDGTRRCVRLQQFLPHSPTTAKVLESERWEQLRTTLAAADELVQARPGEHVVEALVKPPGVVRGISDVNFHRDCHIGGHPYNCSGVDIGIAVTGSDETTGRLQVVAGSHRVAIPVHIALSDPYLPVVSVWTEPGDLTVHLSCTLHESTPPVTRARKVMYTPFKLAPRTEDAESAAHDPVARGRIGAIIAGDRAPRPRASGS